MIPISKKKLGGDVKAKHKTKRGKYHEWLTEEGLLKIEGMARDGLTDDQIAHNIGITARTLYRWKDEYSQICQSLKKGKEVVDRQVENALLKRALGFEYEETKIIIEKDEQGRDKKRQEKIIKRALPDTGAIAFWLKNRKPVEWRDKHELQHSGAIDIVKKAKEIEEQLFGDD